MALMNSEASLSPLLAFNAQGRLRHRQQAPLRDRPVAVSAPPVTPLSKPTKGLPKIGPPFQELASVRVGYLGGLGGQRVVMKIPDVGALFR